MTGCASRWSPSGSRVRSGEVSRLQRQVRQLTHDLEKAKSEADQSSQKAATDAREHKAEVHRLQFEIHTLHQVLIWKTNLRKWIEAEWDKQG